MKLIITDLDGTLFDTSKANYFSYKAALNQYGYELDYHFFKKKCNGRHYTYFLPEILGENSMLVEKIHEQKKKLYLEYIHYAIPNSNLFDLLSMAKVKCKIALVTTASKKNTSELLCAFDKHKIFDLILTQDDINNPKPDPEGFVKAMDYFQISVKDTIIFEDSEVGISAANTVGADVVRVLGYA